MQLRFSVELPGHGFIGGLDLTATIDDAATGRDLLLALGKILPASHHDPLAGDERVDVVSANGRRVVLDTSVPLAGRVFDGCIVRVGLPIPYARLQRVASDPAQELVDPPAIESNRDDGLEVVVVGGLDAGVAVPFDGDGIVVGRVGVSGVMIDDRTVSDRHLRLDIHALDGLVRATDLASFNGSFVNERAITAPTRVADGDVIRAGASEIEVQRRSAPDRPAGLGTAASVAFNRPPRMPVPENVSPIAPPRPPVEPTGRAPFRVAAILIPLLFAAVLVTVTHNPVFALFALMSPAMMIANTISDRRHNRRQARTERSRYAAAVAEFEELVIAGAIAHRDAQREALTNPAEIVRRATTPSRRLWERRAHHGDAYLVRLGSASCRWVPAMTELPAPSATAVRDVLQRHERIVGLPVSVDLGRGALLGIAGSREFVTGVARSLVIQLATLHGPSDAPLAFAFDDTSFPEWEWVKWLPHLGAARLDAGGGSDGTSGCGVAVGPEAMIELARSFQTATPGGGSNRVARNAPSASATASSPGTSVEPTTMIVVDAIEELQRAVQLRRVFGDRSLPVAGIVLAPSIDALPANCTAIVASSSSLPDVETSASLAQFDVPATGTTITDVLVSGMSTQTALRVATSLARLRDPDIDDPGAGLPESGSIRALLELGTTNQPEELADVIEARWRDRRVDAAPVTTIGVSDTGPLRLDLGRDGPHGLVGGTTGAGKSELLRSLVLGLAVECRSDELTFVFIDYKGGSAFDACARLPHVVGLVTDLDASLSARAVRCLEAELRYRERLLRSAEVSDRESYARKGSPNGPLPRLLIVVDEFAALRTELPDFVDALIDVAQRGRSLGVHLILATQRPAGVVSDLIRANTEFKIALRVQDASDSVDVIGTPLAAHLPRARPGRAVLRIGSDEPLVFQSAFSGSPAVAADEAEMVVLEHFGLPTSAGGSLVGGRSVGGRSVVGSSVGGRSVVGSSGGGSSGGGSSVVGSSGGGSSGVVGAARAPTELEVIVDAVRAADARLGLAAPRRPWPEPLPDALSWSALAISVADVEPGHDGVSRPVGTSLQDPLLHDPLLHDPVVGMIDDPDGQRRLPLTWDRHRGNLFLVGHSTKTTSAAMITVVASLAKLHGSTTLHVYGLGAGAGWTAEFEALPHVGALVRFSDRPRLVRLIRHLAEERRRRLLMSENELADAPALVVLIDSIAAAKTELDDPLATSGPFDQLLRVMQDGPTIRMHSIIGVDRPSMLAGPIGAVAEQRWIFELTDKLDLSSFGLRASEVPPLRGLRAVLPHSGLCAQVAEPPSANELVALADDDRARRHLVGVAPAPISVLLDSVSWSDLQPGSRPLLATRPWRFAVGVADSTLAPIALEAHAGEHLLVCGAIRSGRTTMLEAVGASMMDAGGRVVVVAPTRSPLASRLADAVAVRPADLADLASLFSSSAGADRPTVLLVDDAELFEDSQSILTTLVTAERDDLLVVAAVRSEHLRTNYGHWTRLLRRSRLAVLLQPTETDAEFAGVAIPRRAAPMGPGRGYLAAQGTLELVQFARC